MIPCIDDYRSRGLHEELWWQPCELADFKNDAIREILTVMKGQSLEAKDAISYLTQQFTNADTSVAVSFSSDSEDMTEQRQCINVEFISDIEPGFRPRSVSSENTSTKKYVHPLAILAS